MHFQTLSCSGAAGAEQGQRPLGLLVPPGGSWRALGQQSPPERLGTAAEGESGLGLAPSQPRPRCLSSRSATAAEGTRRRWPWSRTPCGSGDLPPSCTVPPRPGTGGCFSGEDKDRRGLFITTSALLHGASEGESHG